MEPIATPSPVPSYLASIARAVLTAAGGWAVNHGYVQSDQVQQLVGAVLVLLAVAWSLWQKRNAHVDAKNAVAVVNAQQSTISTLSSQIVQSQGTSTYAPSTTLGG